MPHDATKSLLKIQHASIKIPRAVAKTQYSQINKCLKKKNKPAEARFLLFLVVSFFFCVVNPSI